MENVGCLQLRSEAKPHIWIPFVESIWIPMGSVSISPAGARRMISCTEKSRGLSKTRAPSVSLGLQKTMLSFVERRSSAVKLAW